MQRDKNESLMTMQTKNGESNAAQVEMMIPGWIPRMREQTDPTPPSPPARLPRITRLMALAIKFQDMVDRGVFATTLTSPGSGTLPEPELLKS